MDPYRGYGSGLEKRKLGSRMFQHPQAGNNSGVREPWPRAAAARVRREPIRSAMVPPGGGSGPRGSRCQLPRHPLQPGAQISSWGRSAAAHPYSFADNPGRWESLLSWTPEERERRGKLHPFCNLTLKCVYNIYEFILFPTCQVLTLLSALRGGCQYPSHLTDGHTEARAGEFYKRPVGETPFQRPPKPVSRCRAEEGRAGC